MKNINRLIVAAITGILIILPIIPAYAEEDEGTQPAGELSVTKLSLDNQNKYEGMDKSYSEGYIPHVENGVAYIVLPILSSGELKNNSLTVSLNLGDAQSMPFVCKNYAKTLYYQESNVNDNTSVARGYVASFGLELKGDRYNGSYPVIMSVTGTDKEGIEIMQEFTVYVNITDEKNPNEEESTQPESQPVFAPKVLVQSYKFSKESITAGEDVNVDIAIVNMSREEPVKNMTFAIKEQGEFFSLLNQSDSTYIESIPAGGTQTVSYSYRVNPETPQGQYDFEVAMDYNDSKGGAYNTQGTVKCNVTQPSQVQFDTPNIPGEAEVADILDVQIQAMNLGRGNVHNVRAVIEADGLIPDGTVFIGDIEAGQTATGSTRISVTGLTKSDSIYGETNGTITYLYNDESGSEHSEVKEFTTSVTSPFTNEQKAEADEPGQWWIIMAILFSVIIIFIIVMVLRIRMHRRLADEMA